MSADVESCEVCGFVWDRVSPAEVAPRIVLATSKFDRLLKSDPERARRRPTPDRWSALEYGCHVRDVLIHVRDRVVLGAVDDNPTPHALYGSQRIELGLYANEVPSVVGDELRVVGALFGRTFDSLPPGFGDRPMFHGWPRAATRTLSWVAAQALHECEHHLADAQEDLGALA